jgi:hypothetical protein
MNFGLLLSQVILFAAAAGLGFAVGWRSHLAIAAARVRAADRDTQRLRSLLSQLQSRRNS